MASFRKKNLRRENLGQILSWHRYQKKLDLPLAANILNIRTSYLQALESGDFDNLPADVYTKGFLKKYARLLGLDELKTIKLFLKEKKIYTEIKSSAAPAMKTFMADKTKKSRLSLFFKLSPRTIKLLAVCLTVALFLIYLAYQFLGFSGAPILEVAEPSDNLVIQESNLIVKGQTDPDNEIFINQQRVLLKNDGLFEERVDLKPGINTLRVIAKNKLNKTTETVRHIKLISDEQPVVAGQANERRFTLIPGCITKLEVSIKNNPTWLRMVVDDNLAFEGIMAVGESRKFEAKREIKLTTGKAGNTFINWQGQDLGSLGSNDEVIRDKIFSVK